MHRSIAHLRLSPPGSAVRVPAAEVGDKMSALDQGVEYVAASGIFQIQRQLRLLRLSSSHRS